MIRSGVRTTTRSTPHRGVTARLDPRKIYIALSLSHERHGRMDVTRHRRRKHTLGALVYRHVSASGSDKQAFLSTAHRRVLLLSFRSNRHLCGGSIALIVASPHRRRAWAYALGGVGRYFLLAAKPRLLPLDGAAPSPLQAPESRQRCALTWLEPGKHLRHHDTSLRRVGSGRRRGYRSKRNGYGLGLR